MTLSPFEGPFPNLMQRGLSVKIFKTRNVYFVFPFNNVNYGAWFVYKPLFGCSVATCWLACSEISVSIIGKKLKRSHGKGWTYYNLADSVTALAQLYALYSHRVRSFNQWQRALYPNFIIKNTSTLKHFWFAHWGEKWAKFLPEWVNEFSQEL